MNLNAGASLCIRCLFKGDLFKGDLVNLTNWTLKIINLQGPDL